MVQKSTNLELSIIELLTNKENHVRGIANDLLEHHSTILRRLNNLIELKVVDFRVEGKNKVFFLKDNFLTKSFISQSEINKMIELIKLYPEFSIIFEEIIKKCSSNLIVLFGSYAKGNAKKDSDIDIYIESNNRSVKKKIEAINSKISVKLGPFDKESPLIREIIKNHVILRGLDYFYENK